jgi:hypothetical protein
MLPVSVSYLLVSCAGNATRVLFANGNLHSNICILQCSLLLVAKEQFHYHFLRSTFSNFEQLCSCLIIILIFTKNPLTGKKKIAWEVLKRV